MDGGGRRNGKIRRHPNPNPMVGQRECKREMCVRGVADGVG